MADAGGAPESLFKPSADDRSVVAFHFPLIETALKTAIDELYHTVVQSPLHQAIFVDTASLERARAAQYEHWCAMLNSDFGMNHVIRAKRIGLTHARIGLTLEDYIGGTSLVLSAVTRELARLDPDDFSVDLDELLPAMTRCVMRDMAMVVSAYLDAAESASIAKSRFMANMSHELKTPLNAIIGYAELLRDDVSGQAARDVEQILTAGRRLLDLINNLLELARIGAGAIELREERVDVVALARNAIEAVQPIALSRGNSVSFSSDAPAMLTLGDSERLEQCLTQVLGNAAKFTEYGSISIHVARRWRHSRPFIDVVVSDTGIGMSKQQVERAFHALEQGDESYTKRFEGVGVGLALTSRLVQLMGAEISIDSEEGKGSTVTISLPGAAATMVQFPQRASLPSHPH